MSNEPKFKIGDRVRTRYMREGVVTGLTAGPYVWAQFDEAAAKHVWEGDLELLPESRRITSAEQIRTGATYDLAGAKLTGQSDDEDHYCALRDSAGVIVLNHIELKRLFELNAVITEVAPPPDPAYVEPDWQPGDWVRDANDPQAAWYVYVPDSMDEPTPHCWMSQKCGFYQRKELPDRLALAYRHEATS